MESPSPFTRMLPRNRFADSKALVQVEPGIRRMLDPSLSIQTVQGRLNPNLETVTETVVFCALGASEHADC